jgi:ABC-2 type transport system permease protein
MLASINLPAWLLGVGAVYLLLGYLLYGSMLGGIGASSQSAQEASSIAGIFSLLAMSPMFAFANLLKDSNSALQVALSLIPFTSPTAMMMRISMGEVPVWQIILSLLLLAAGTALVIWLAAWTFRVGLLMTGKRLKIKTLFHVIRRGSNQTAVLPNQNLAENGR